MLNTSALKERLKQLDLELTKPIPTPPIASTVVWYEGGKTREQNGEQRAAIVVGIEGPGKLRLKIFDARAMDKNKSGVLHVDHKIHQQKNNSVTVQSGAWDYPDDRTPPKSHFKLHEDFLKKQRDQVERDIAAHEAANEQEKLAKA